MNSVPLPHSVKVAPLPAPAFSSSPPVFDEIEGQWKSFSLSSLLQASELLDQCMKGLPNLKRAWDGSEVRILDAQLPVKFSSLSFHLCLHFVTQPFIIFCFEPDVIFLCRPIFCDNVLAERTEFGAPRPGPEFCYTGARPMRLCDATLQRTGATITYSRRGRVGRAPSGASATRLAPRRWPRVVFIIPASCVDRNT
jgi:hypothetical protein